ncbi:hypothetical protein V1519DRAFT_443996 [Lipomyces tetrasporus]
MNSAGEEKRSHLTRALFVSVCFLSLTLTLHNQHSNASRMRCSAQSMRILLEWEVALVPNHFSRAPYYLQASEAPKKSSQIPQCTACEYNIHISLIVSQYLYRSIEQLHRQSLPPSSLST